MKTTVITGASSGIGAELARQLASKGFNVVLAARRDHELREIADEIGANAYAVVTDVRSRIDIENLKNAALDKFGAIDIWVNNAGRGICRNVLELSDEDFDEIINVNLKSALYGMQSIIPYFIERGAGHLINISSFLARVPYVPFRSIYSASKAALNILTANLRMDMKNINPDIHISTVMPGMVFTDFSKNAIGGPPSAFTPLSGAKPQTAAEAVSAIVAVVEKPQAEIYTNPALAELANQYNFDVAAFENNMPGKSL